MKKIVSLFTAAVLILAMSATAFAAEVTIETTEATGNTSSADVTVKIDGDSASNITSTYNVVIEWDSLDFTYTFDKNNTNTWKASDHTYEEANGATTNWDKTTAAIKVTNHSNEAVAIAAEIAGGASATANGVTAALDKTSFELATGVGLTYETAASDTFTLSVSGVPTIEEEFKIDTVTVTVSAN